MENRQHGVLGDNSPMDARAEAGVIFFKLGQVRFRLGILGGNIFGLPTGARSENAEFVLPDLRAPGIFSHADKNMQIGPDWVPASQR